MNTADKARQVVEQLVGIEHEHGADTMFAVIEEKVSAPEVRAALLLMVQLDRQRQRGPVRVEIELEALDFIAEAKDDPAAILALIRRLTDDEQREALGNLILLHRDLTAAEISAAQSARDN